MKRYYLTPEQQDQIGKDITDIGRQLLAIKFEEPSSDEKMIRHHAYLTGKFNFCQQLLEDEFPEPDKTTEDESLQQNSTQL